ncbi:MAG TPA: PD-(D/E)XK nuclease family protein [Thermomicrobiales bacterium]|nr:PD-(D/E)XK nuclease family protein [Thermomicrobiales bacterium]
MSLPIDFVASATALECYEVCPRRFQHRYLDRVPAAGPDRGVTLRTQRGDIFHKLVVWESLGLDTSVILGTTDDPELPELWDSFQAFHATMRKHGATLRHDRTLTATCGPYSVMARVDTLSTGDAGVTIYDWKTSARPDRGRLIDSAQSKVYPYVVYETMRDAAPDSLSLVYWFAADPGNPLRIDFDAGKLDDTSSWLSNLLVTIAADREFSMTEDRRVCTSCEYLAHCGVRAEGDDSWEMDEDYYQPVDDVDDVPVDDEWWL